MKYWVICDYRENLRNYSKNTHEIYNDHPAQKNIIEIIDAINSLGYQCEYFGGIPELIHAIDNNIVFEDCMFLNFTDGLDQNYSRVQAPVLLDILNVPYSGSDVFPSVIMNNKYYCKQILKDINVMMAKSLLITSSFPLDLKEIAKWTYPLFVKPNCEGSSLGISQRSVCHNEKEVIDLVNSLLPLYEELIIEEYIQGIDITNYLIGNKGKYYIDDIVVAELFGKSPYTVYDAEIKHNKLRTLFYNEEKIAPHVIEKIRNCSTKIAETLGTRDICRIDYRLNIATEELYFIEINSAPRFSSTSEIGFIAQKRNLSFKDMLGYYLKSFNERIS